MFEDWDLFRFFSLEILEEVEWSGSRPNFALIRGRILLTLLKSLSLDSSSSIEIIKFSISSLFLRHLITKFQSASESNERLLIDDLVFHFFFSRMFIPDEMF